jgi:hypothetical protein
MLKHIAVATAFVLAVLGVWVVAMAHDNEPEAPASVFTFDAFLNGYQAVPTLSLPRSVGSATFTVRRDSTIDYSIEYRLVPADTGPATQVHLHLGRRATEGGVIAFLCSNLGNAPAGTPACPTVAGTVTGTWTAASIVGPAGQGIAPGEFQEVVKALRARATYACIHTTVFVDGSIRGQVQ